ncbi:MAG TPA: hypothetical protein VI454_14625 [Verrucomicrobiae bacterium]
MRTSIKRLLQTGRVWWLAALFLAPLAGRAQPQVNELNPFVGTTNDHVMVIGSGFAPGGSSVGTAVYFNDGTLLARSWFVVSDSQINDVIVPTNAVTGAIVVSNFFTGTGTSASPFVVIGYGPYITNFTPGAGVSGNSVTIQGPHVNGGGYFPTNVSFNGVTSPSLNTATIGQVVASVPFGASSGPISVATLYGTNFSSSNFYLPPSITGIAPTSGVVGATVNITGQNFLDAAAVQFTGAAGAFTNAVFTFLSNTNLTATVPPGARTGSLRVVAPAGLALSPGNFLVAPVIASFTPAGGPVGTNVTIVGTNLFNVSSVTFNGTASTQITTNNAGTNVIARVPNTTTGFIVVTTPSGSATSAVPFYLPPSISTLQPNQGRAGDVVTIGGINLSGATNVTFNGFDASFTNLSALSLNAVVPGAALTGPVVVRTPGGVATSPQSFLIQPLITGFSPAAGVVGDPVTITGTNFTSSAAVLFNGTNAIITMAALTQLTALVPTNATTGPITVLTIGGSDTTTNNFLVLASNIFLSLRLSNSLAIVSWPTNPPGFRLQTKIDLATNFSWLEAGGVTSLIGGRLTVTNDTTATNRFFRLIHQP